MLLDCSVGIVFVVFLDVDCVKFVVESDNIAPEHFSFPACCLKTNLLNPTLKHLNRHISIATNLQHFQAKIDHEKLFLQAFDQLKDFCEINFCLVELEIKVANALEHSESIKKVLQVLDIVEGEV